MNDPVSSRLADPAPASGAAVDSRPFASVRRPELLAPAGDWDCVRAAVENGADAIYFGLDQFNARMRAKNFAAADLPELIRYLHGRGVKAYVTFNTLVFPEELAPAAEFVRSMIRAGVDGAIVQDVGICRLIRRWSPDFPIHASTQMTITSAAGVAFARELGCSVVVLAREVSVSEISRIQDALRQVATPAGDGDRGPGSGIPQLEVFVHGALCVAYSGQCLTSESLGGRSANRGVCAQACRMPYDLLADGKAVDLGDRRYLLSPQDLSGIEVLPALLRAGVASLKIEGRLKTPEYVANITRVYRRAVDEVFTALSSDAASAETTAAQAAQAARESSRYALEMAFSRGLHTGWLQGTNNQTLVHGRFGKKRGVFLGTVRWVRGETVGMELEGPLKPGDGVVFDAGRPDLEEEGGRVYELRPAPAAPGQPRLVQLAFGRGAVDFRRVSPGDRVWKTSDPELERELRRTFEGDAPRFLRPLRMEVRGAAGESLRLRAWADDLPAVEVASAMPLASAERQPLTLQRLREQLGRLGGTPYRLEALDSHLAGDVILPVSELNRLRREVAETLARHSEQAARWTLRADAGPEPSWRGAARAGSEAPAELIVLVRSLAQLEAALAEEVGTLYCDFEDPKKYREAVRLFREWQRISASRRAASVWVAPPRIFKTGEEWTLRQVRSCEADGYLVRNYDHLSFFADQRRVGDFSLNVANGWAAEYFLERYGLERVTASYDLNHVELKALLRSAPPAWFEITVHQHMPMFHMEHCLFCAFLSAGTDYTNCGRPCDRQEVRLRDRVGVEHPVKADVGCRNTVFNARAQTGAEHVADFLGLGARRFRLEFLNESGAQLRRTLGLYRRLLAGDLRGTELWQELKLDNQLGVTRGPLAAR